MIDHVMNEYSKNRIAYILCQRIRNSHSLYMSINDFNIRHNDSLDQYTFTCLNLKYEEEICILMTAVSFRSC